MKFPPDFHNYIGLNGVVNSLLQFTIAPPNKLILSSKPHRSAKRKQVSSMCSAKKLSYKFRKIHREIPVLEHYSNTVKSLQAVRFTRLLKTLALVFKNQSFVDALQNSLIIHKIHREIFVESPFK